MKQITLSQAREDLTGLLRMAQKERIMLTRRGKPAGVVIGFADDDDRFDYELENDPRFLKSIEQARKSIREGKGRRIEDIA